ncbi:MAG: hypothetical protein NT076_02170 [Candidatus Pacearchaeota archaeon]|nr:hypothetical protein [Candidatus Pacearchaeota archaeon]
MTDKEYEVIIEMKGYKCLRCGEVWIPRKKHPAGKEIPDVCPRCKSHSWQTKVRFPTISKAQKKRKR